MGAPPTRRVGLSYRNAPQPLLKSVKSRSKPTAATTAKTTTASKPEPQVGSRRSSLKIPDPVPDDDDDEDITAPPLASSDLEDDDDDENADNTETKPEPDQLFGDSSDSDTPPDRGGISSTVFKPLGRNGGRQGRQRTSQETKTAEDSEDESQLGTRKRKWQSDTPNDKSNAKKKNAFVNPPALPSSSASHLTNDLGFTKQAKVKATFSKKQTYRKPRDELPAPRFLAPPPPLPGHSVRKSSEFIVPSSPEPSPIRRPRYYLQPPPENTFDTEDDDDDTAAFSQPKSIPEEDDFAARLKPRAKRKPNPLISRKKSMEGGKKKEQVKPAPKSPSSPAPSFVMPAQPSDFVFAEHANGDAVNDDDDGLSDSSSLSSLGSIFSDKDSKKETGAPCPWCGATVDSEQLADFAKGKRLNVERQQKFCASHKKKAAIAAWESNSYPQVEWTKLESRFAKHHDHLVAIINGEASHYRTALADKIELGKERTAKKQGNMIPGYYGPRGFNVMTDYLVREFSDMLMKKAARDKVIAGRGVPMFIESVLVAELGVRLIMEDMCVSPDKARRILEESKDLGGLVHPEER
ncbi:RTC4-like domain-containing protein [Trichoderma novae-zelandiae]